jgi:hypothetical protein
LATYRNENDWDRTGARTTRVWRWGLGVEHTVIGGRNRIDTIRVARDAGRL